MTPSGKQAGVLLQMRSVSAADEIVTLSVVLEAVTRLVNIYG